LTHWSKRRDKEGQTTERKKQQQTKLEIISNFI
jgi:hypothetical protein